jgi:hypothetical protein
MAAVVEDKSDDNFVGFLVFPGPDEDWTKKIYSATSYVRPCCLWRTTKMAEMRRPWNEKCKKTPFKVLHHYTNLSGIWVWMTLTRGLSKKTNHQILWIHLGIFPRKIPLQYASQNPVRTWARSLPNFLVSGFLVTWCSTTCSIQRYYTICSVCEVGRRPPPYP